jgi:hypothetical protein
MITFTKAYVSGGRAYATLEEAKAQAIREIMLKQLPHEQWTIEQVAGAILDLEDELVSILTTTDSSRPRARAINGGTKKRRKKDSATAIAAEAVA